MDRDLLAENKRLKENNDLLHEFIESNRTTYLKEEIRQYRSALQNIAAGSITANTIESMKYTAGKALNKKEE